MKIYELLSSEDKWIKGDSARDVNDNMVFPTDKAACKWCLLGAAIKCYSEHMKVSCMLDKILGKIQTGIPVWNDTHTYEDVITLVKELDI